MINLRKELKGNIKRRTKPLVDKEEQKEVIFCLKRKKDEEPIDIFSTKKFILQIYMMKILLDNYMKLRSIEKWMLIGQPKKCKDR